MLRRLSPFFKTAWLVVGCLPFFIGPASAAALPAQQVFEEWLAAYNANNAEALRAFNAQRMGDPDIAFVLDSREETGGLDLVKIERNAPLTFIALARERAYPALQRVTLTLERAGSSKVLTLDQRPQRLSQEEALASLNSFIERLAANDRFSGVVVIEQNGKHLYEKAIGAANRATGVAVQLNTPFFIASQGKMFTGVAVLQLVEAGRVALDDPLGKYLTDYPNRDVAAKVTIRHLLTHQGGVGDIGILEPEEAANRAWVRTIADLIKLNGARPPQFEPGSRMEYSNYGFIF